MNEKKILAYLQEHPEFLLNHAADLGVRPVEGRVQSFAQAQWLAQQKKAAKMAGQLAQIMQDADSNHQTLGRMLGYLKIMPPMPPCLPWKSRCAATASRRR